MENEKDKLISEQWKILPPNLQRAINALLWKSLTQEIGRANSLGAEQVVSLEQETMFVLYALENPVNFISNVVKNVGVTEEVATMIAESVADKIFDPILRKSEEQVSSKNLPMVEEGEVAHTVPHIEESKPRVPAPEIAPLPDYRYAEGKDPYREPLV